VKGDIMKLELKERKDGLTWVAVLDKKDRQIGWVGLLDFIKGECDTTSDVENRRVTVAKCIVESFNKEYDDDKE